MKRLKVFFSWCIDEKLIMDSPLADFEMPTEKYGTPLKYYATDIGLRNAKLNFRQQERSHMMENLIYNELIIRGYAVDVGVVEVVREKEGKRVQSQYEIDFVVNQGAQKIYIQCALNVDTDEKKRQETFSLKNSGLRSGAKVLHSHDCYKYTEFSNVTLSSISGRSVHTITLIHYTPENGSDMLENIVEKCSLL